MEAGAEPAPFHRVASRWATSVVCGALCAALVLGLLLAGDALWRGRGIPDYVLVGTAILGAGFLAFLAPLEAAAAAGRRFGVRLALLLILLAPAAGALLFVAGESWLDALLAGDPGSFVARLGDALRSMRPTLEPFGYFLVLVGPLGVARALEARPRRVALVTAIGALLVWLQVYWTRASTEVDELWPTFVIGAATVAAGLGLCLGDRLEVRLAARVRRSLPGGAPSAPDGP